MSDAYEGPVVLPDDASLVIVNDDIWAGLRERPEFKLRKEADKESYIWDRLIDILSEPDAKAHGASPVGLSFTHPSLYRPTRRLRLRMLSRKRLTRSPTSS